MTITQPSIWQRTQALERLGRSQPFDVIIVGGGATGLGIALDASLRGLSVALLESGDFGRGTSSRATKLVHGGVRYLAQGNIGLVREALHERTTILANAPHLAGRLPFVMPSYACWEMPFYGVGLKAYDALAGRDGLGRTRFLNAREAAQAVPGIRRQGLKGGVTYWDGQFDDARLALALARTAAQQGATLLNYCRVDGLLHSQQRVAGVQCRDLETGNVWSLKARTVINATGVWVDAVRAMDAQAGGVAARPLVTPSQGIHLVVERDFFPGHHALLVPRTRDGRVLFAVPWLGKVILGTTDTPRTDLPEEPHAHAAEIDFILEEAGRYLSSPPSRDDVRSVWAGLRPLVRDTASNTGDTGRISREHTIQISPSGLLTVTGGKWTTYRAMAEDVLACCVRNDLLPGLPPSRTARFPLIGSPEPGSATRSLGEPPGLSAYGAEASQVESLDGGEPALGGGLTPGMVRFAVSHEYARTVEDVLARRSRLLFLDAQLAMELAPDVARVMQTCGLSDPQLDAFLDHARHYHQLP